MKCKHAALEIRLDLFLIDALRELEGAQERAVRPLDNLIAVVLTLLPLAPFLTANGKHAVFRHYLDVFRLQTRELEFEPDLVVVLLDVDCRCKAVPIARKSVLEQPVDFAPESENRCALRHSVKHFRLL